MFYLAFINNYCFQIYTNDSEVKYNNNLQLIKGGIYSKGCVWQIARNK